MQRWYQALNILRKYDLNIYQHLFLFIYSGNLENITSGIRGTNCTSISVMENGKLNSQQNNAQKMRSSVVGSNVHTYRPNHQIAKYW